MFNSQFFFTHGFKINSEEKKYDYIITPMGHLRSLLTFFTSRFCIQLVHQSFKNPHL